MVLNILSIIANKLSKDTRLDINSDSTAPRTSTSSTQREWPQIIAILAACIGAMGAGLHAAWPSSAIPVLISPEFPGNITLSETSYLIIASATSFAVTSPLFAVLPDRIGRKPCLLIFMAVPQLIAWLLIAFVPTLGWLCVARFMVGISDSCLFAVLPMYIAEIATPAVRGTWGNALVVALFIGMFIVNAVGSFLSIQFSAMILGSVPVLFLCTFHFIPESPYYFLMKGQQEKAKQSLKWLREGTRNYDKCSEHTEAEFMQISSAVARQLSERGRIRDLFVVSSNRKALIIGAVARLAQQFGACTFTLVYSKYLFKLAGGSIDETTCSLVFFGTFVIAISGSSILLDRIGRKQAMTISSLMAGVSLAALSLFLYLKDHSTLDLSGISWFPIAGMLAYVISMSAGLCSIPTLLIGEIFSSSIKAKALCLMNICFALFLGVSNTLFQAIMSAYGLYVSFAVSAAFTLFFGIISYYIIPNTNGKTLEQIQQDLKKQ